MLSLSPVLSLVLGQRMAVSEGVQDASGAPVATKLVEGLDRDMHGNVQLSGVSALGDALADHVKKNLRVGGLSIRVRADTFGYLQRSWPDPSPIDSSEARAVGKFAVGLAKKGERSGSVAIVRKSSSPYRSELKRIELTDVAGKTRRMPPEFIEGHNNVSRAFIRYCKPLVGDLPEMVRI